MDETQQFLFILLAVVGACWLTARAAIFVWQTLSYLAELMACKDDDDKVTFL